MFKFISEAQVITATGVIGQNPNVKTGFIISCMGKQLTKKNVGYFLDRIHKLHPGLQPAWGKLTVTGMMCHYTIVTQEILKAPATATKPTAKQNAMKFVGLYVMRHFPKGVKSSDEYVKDVTELLNFDTEKSKPGKTGPLCCGL